MGKILTSIIAGAMALGLASCEKNPGSYEPTLFSEREKQHQINIDNPKYSLKLELKGNLAKEYQRNPHRVENYLRTHLSSAFGDIITGGGLDDVLNAMNVELIEKKLEILRNYSTNPMRLGDDKAKKSTEL